MYPAKFTFFVNNTPSCANDFAVFNTGLPGLATQASILAYKNLYSGTLSGDTVCGTSRTQANVATNGTNTNPVLTAGSSVFTAADVGALVTGSTIPHDTIIVSQTGTTATMSKNATSSGNITITIVPAPKVLWAYNTGGTVMTSPVLTFDPTGSQVAFIQTPSSGSAQLVILKWASSTSQSATLPQTLTAVAASSYRSCGAPCMTTLTFSGSGTYSDTNSSPFVDYNKDVLYVGDDVGSLHKFTGVFNGSPMEAGAPWPVAVGSGKLTSPVGVSTTQVPAGVVLVGIGGSSGGIVSVSSDGSTLILDKNAANPGHSPSTIGAPRVPDAPIVDQPAGELYVGVSNDGGPGIHHNSGALQFPTSFTISTVPVESATGSESDTVSFYAGAFDHAYLTSASASSPTGAVYFCANPGGNPTLFRIPIAANVMSTTTTSSAVASAGTTCSPVTELFNSPKDRVFLSVTASGNQTGCTGACVYSFDITSGLPNNTAAAAGLASPGGSSGIIVDNVSGTTGTSQVYFSALGNSTCTTNPNGSTGCAVQASQSALQ
jgi:hypothetical protein